MLIFRSLNMRQLVLELLLAICILFCAKSNCYQITDNPLYLTPYIEAGKISEAKQKAQVHHVEMQNVESYSGYITINKNYNSNTFFWYFPAQHNSSMEPLILWMNGGPGSSSLEGLFTESGPFFVNADYTLNMRNESWHKNHNVIYIDNPVGAGFSFTENELGYAKVADDVGRDVLTFLLQFFKLFPELRHNDFFVAGESYAGKYVPAVSHAIKVHNKGTNGTINIKGLAIGNGLTDPINQFKHADFLFSLGLIDSSTRETVKDIENGIKDLIRNKKYASAKKSYHRLFFPEAILSASILTKLTGIKQPYNFLQNDIPQNFSYFQKWVEKPHNSKALHVRGMKFWRVNETVQHHFEEDMMKSIAHYMEDLLESYKVLLYNGQLDMLIPHVATENYVSHLNWSGAEEYKTTIQEPWAVENTLAGYVKTVKNLNLVLVRNAGHFALADQPLWTWDMITRFTHNQNLKIFKYYSINQ